MNDQPHTDRPEVDDPRVLALAKARQQMAYRNPFNVVCPPWDGLSEQEQHLSLLDARNYLRAALDAGLVPAAVSVTAPPADQAALRDRIAAAIWAQYSDAEPSRTGLVMANPHAVADAVLGVLPEPADRAAVLAEAIRRVEDPEERAKTATGLGLGWEAARDVLRRMADEAQQQEPGRSDVGTEFVRQVDAPDEAGLAAFEADLAEAQQQPDTETRTPWTPAPVALARSAEWAHKRQDATVDPAMCPRCKGDNQEAFELCPKCAAVSGPGGVADENPAETRCTCADAGACFAPSGHYADCPQADQPAAGTLQPETQAAPMEAAETECAHCWRLIENRSTPNMGGPPRDNWVHVPGGFTVCFPQRGADSPRAEPKPAVVSQPGKET